MGVNERYPNHTRACIKAGINLKNLTLGEFWETADEREKKGIKGRSNRRVIGNLFSALYSHRFGRRKSIVPSKDCQNITALNGF